jgi:hypothetical protein
MAGRVHHGPQDLGREHVEPGGQRLEEPSPGAAVRAEAFGRLGHRPGQDGRVSAVERMGQLDRRPPPPQPVPLQVQRAQER